MESQTLTFTRLLRIKKIIPGDNLPDIICKSLMDNKIELENGDILVLAQKIVSKAEGRLVNLSDVSLSRKAKRLAKIVGKNPALVELILQESNKIVRMRKGTIIAEHKSGFICANAGIDHSNVMGDWGKHEDWVLLLPKDSDASAEIIRKEIEQRTQKQIGILIIDSYGRAWRLGTIGMSIGISGIPALVDMRGQSDMFNYQLRVTIIAAADELAAGASLMMGQADEGTPVIHVRGFPYKLRESTSSELIRPKHLDLFR